MTTQTAFLYHAIMAYNKSYNGGYVLQFFATDNVFIHENRKIRYKYFKFTNKYIYTYISIKSLRQIKSAHLVLEWALKVFRSYFGTPILKWF